MTSFEFDPTLSSQSIMQAFDAGWLGLGQIPVPTARQVEEIPFSFHASDKTESTSETTSEWIWALVCVEAHGHEIRSKVQRFFDNVSAYEDRISVLKEQAELEGYSLSDASKTSFWRFLRKNPFMRRGRLVLMENGNLRAVWKGENGAHVGLQFLNDLSIQYVIFRRREPDLPVSRVSGRDTMDGISRQIDAFDLDSLLYT